MSAVPRRVRRFAGRRRSTILPQARRLAALLLGIVAQACADGNGSAEPGATVTGDSPPVPAAGRAAPSSAGPEIVVRAAPGLEGIARRVGHDPGVWASLPAIDDAVLAGRPVTVWFVRDLSSLDSLGLGRPEPWVAGVADPGRRMIALRVDGAGRNLARLRGVYRHEAAHVALHAATGGAAPRWLHEGYAQLASGTWDWREGWRLQFLLMRGGEGLLTDLDRRFRSGLEPEAAYILSYTAVETLHAMGGTPGLAALFADLRAGRSLDGALRDVYGVTAEQFERRWRERVLDRYGWLYLLSRTAFVWLGVTVLIIVLGIARVRHDRRRLAAMRERERREAAALEWLDVDDPTNPS